MDDVQTKDNDKAQLDLMKICRRPDLNLRRVDNVQWAKPKVAFALTKEQRQNVYRWVSELRFPDGYASNLSKCANISLGVLFAYPGSCKSSWVVVVKTKSRGHIESYDRTEGQELYQIDDPTTLKMVVDTSELITLSSAVTDDDIINLELQDNTLPQQDDDLEEEEVDMDKEEEDEFNDKKTISEEEDGETEEKDDEFE
ncbi:uncharacterized protein LOC130957487 [Arachis stenosperma]|uniref:uncharacterized protein LOC130957487 n=1 Tax=Arachis stenosperma TaxID=217475 RepID=UPI0025AC098C|nr:uncharacterized protein LOC130957487 [Arachis stenosperma]